MSKSPVQMINNDLGPLAPFFREKLLLAMKECKDRGFNVEIFEGWRSPDRQDWLWEQGRVRPGKIITGAKAWQSWHQYGLAVDMVAKVKGRWDWSIDYDPIIAIMKAHGFENLSFEKVHFEITGGLNHRDAKKIHDKKGIVGLWQMVAQESAVLN